jgi:predicted esterase YcpF (UPF0227 family)
MEATKLQTVKELKVIFGDCEQFVLTGSLIAHLQGFIAEPKDIDIILVNPAVSAERQLERHVKEFATYPNNQKIIDKGIYCFTFNGTKVDMFVQKEKYDEKLTYDGIILSSFISIVNAKQSYHRLKDFMHLKAWAEMIFNRKNSEAELTTISAREDYQ